MKLAEVTCGKEGYEQRTNSEREDMARGSRIKSANARKEQIGDDRVEESPNNVDR